MNNTSEMNIEKTEQWLKSISKQITVVSEGSERSFEKENK
jgi:hypothetical protein